MCSVCCLRFLVILVTDLSVFLLQDSNKVKHLPKHNFKRHDVRLMCKMNLGALHSL